MVPPFILKSHYCPSFTSVSPSLISTFAYLSTHPLSLSLLSHPLATPSPTSTLSPYPTAEWQSAEWPQFEHASLRITKDLSVRCFSTLADDSSSRSFESPPASLFLFLSLIFLLPFFSPFTLTLSSLALVSLYLLQRLFVCYFIPYRVTFALGDTLLDLLSASGYGASPVRRTDRSLVVLPSRNRSYTGTS